MFKWLLELVKNGIKKVINLASKVISSWFNVDYDDAIEVDEDGNFDKDELLSTLDNIEWEIGNDEIDSSNISWDAIKLRNMVDSIRDHIDDSLYSDFIYKLGDVELFKNTYDIQELKDLIDEM